MGQRASRVRELGSNVSQEPAMCQSQQSGKEPAKPRELLRSE